MPSSFHSRWAAAWEYLAALLDVDVALSTNATGSDNLGGDWDLEFQTGLIQTASRIEVHSETEWHGLLATYTVTNTNNSGAGSLRQAILDANASAGHDTIDFNIPGSGVHTILINDVSLGALPRITDAVSINGYSQLGSQANSLMVGSNAVLLIELRGGLTTAQANAAFGVQGYFGGLMFDDGSSGSSVRGLIVNGFLGNEASNRSGAGSPYETATPAQVLRLQCHHCR